MAKKTQAPSRSLHEHAELQKAADQIKTYRETVARNLSWLRATTANIQEAEKTLFTLESDLRDLLEAQEHGRSPSQGKGAVPVGRNDVDESLPPLPRPLPSKRRVGSYKRLPPCPAIKDLTQFSGI